MTDTKDKKSCIPLFITKICVLMIMCIIFWGNMTITINAEDGNIISLDDNTEDGKIVSPDVNTEDEKIVSPDVNAGHSLSTLSTSNEWILDASGKWWYRHSDGSYTKNDWEYINGKWYHFDSAGWMQTGWIKVNGYWYYLGSDGAMTTGWLVLNNNWYYLNTYSGDMVTGWNILPYGSSREWFYFFSNGVMNNKTMTDILDGDTRTIYFQSSGVWLYTVSLISWDLVDSGKHLDWGGNSQFIAYVREAANKWNAYKPGVIREDTLWTIKDLTISDYHDEKTGVRAYTSTNGTLQFNTYLMSTNDTSGRTLKTIMHEFGHALGLGHNDSQDVMYGYASTVTTLTKSDKKSYDEAYKKY